ncbi:hypothetical protein LP420_37115 [Massilia sp. B-10]|nr:hypothetical protein LP420_37115 [Massilia sp. B-10]
MASCSCACRPGALALRTPGSRIALYLDDSIEFAWRAAGRLAGRENRLADGRHGRRQLQRAGAPGRRLLRRLPGALRPAAAAGR